MARLAGHLIHNTGCSTSLSRFRHMFSSHEDVETAYFPVHDERHISLGIQADKEQQEEHHDGHQDELRNDQEDYQENDREDHWKGSHEDHYEGHHKDCHEDRLVTIRKTISKLSENCREDYQKSTRRKSFRRIRHELKLMCTRAEKEKPSSGYQANRSTSPLFGEAYKEWDTREYQRECTKRHRCYTLLHQRPGTPDCWKNTLEFPELLDYRRTIHLWKGAISVPVAADEVIALSSVYTGEEVATESQISHLVCTQLKYGGR